MRHQTINVFQPETFRCIKETLASCQSVHVTMALTNGIRVTQLRVTL